MLGKHIYRSWNVSCSNVSITKPPRAAEIRQLIHIHTCSLASGVLKKPLSRKCSSVQKAMPASVNIWFSLCSCSTPAATRQHFLFLTSNFLSQPIVPYFRWTHHVVLGPDVTHWTYQCRRTNECILCHIFALSHAAHTVLIDTTHVFFLFYTYSSHIACKTPLSFTHFTPS